MQNSAIAVVNLQANIHSIWKIATSDAVPYWNYHLLFALLFSPSYRVAGITDDLPIPYRLSISSPALSPVLFMSILLVLGRHIFLFPGISVLNSFFSMCSSSLITLECSPLLNRLSGIFLEAYTTLVPRVFVPDPVFACHSSQLV